jgi:hypothetical protein
MVVCGIGPVQPEIVDGNAELARQGSTVPHGRRRRSHFPVAEGPFADADALSEGGDREQASLSRPDRFVGWKPVQPSRSVLSQLTQPVRHGTSVAGYFEVDNAGHPPIVGLHRLSQVQTAGYCMEGNMTVIGPHEKMKPRGVRRFRLRRGRRRPAVAR